MVTATGGGTRRLHLSGRWLPGLEKPQVQQNTSEGCVVDGGTTEPGKWVEQE